MSLENIKEGILGVELPFSLRNSWEVSSCAGGFIEFINDEDEYTIELTPGPAWTLSVFSGERPYRVLLMEFTSHQADIKTEDKE